MPLNQNNALTEAVYYILLYSDTTPWLWNHAKD